MNDIVTIGKTRDLLVHEGWTKGNWYLRDQGFCIEGALSMVLFNRPLVRRERLLSSSAYQELLKDVNRLYRPSWLVTVTSLGRSRKRKGYLNLLTWNDDRGRTKKQVIALLDATLARLNQERIRRNIAEQYPVVIPAPARTYTKEYAA